MADALDVLRALERRDGELAVSADRLRALDTEVASVRTRAAEIDAFFAAYPSTENRLRKAVAGAETELAQREQALADAREAVGAAKNEDAQEAAERTVERLRDQVTVAETRVVRAAEAYDRLERRAASIPSELPELATRAIRVARQLPDGRPAAETPGALIEWAGRAHASLFVAVGQLDAERERIVREANELATTLLGEPTYGSTPAQALARVIAAGPHRSKR